MKKLVFTLIIAFLTINTVFTQNRGNQVGNSQSITVEGTLQLQNGQIAITDENTIYFVPVLNRYIDRLREGARVSILGYASGNILQATQITINGKSYNFLSRDYNNYNSGYGFCCSGWGRR
jgi:hypothetical protein